MDLRKIQVTDSFWKNEMELVRKEVIPYQWEALNDRVEGADPSFAMRNFKVAGKLIKEQQTTGGSRAYYELDKFRPLPEDMDHMEDRFYGFLFQDSDFSKWIEAVGYSLTQHPDEELEKIADEAIDIVCAAQLPDGYLDSYYIIENPEKRFTNLKDNHELYCFGHLTEGAVAYYQATGKDKLLKAVERFADYIDSRFGAEEGKINGYPGHEIAEMALVRLYEITGKEKYLNLSKYFIDERGKQPYYYDKEHKVKAKEGDTSLRYQYNQAHLPVREQEEAVGHAVRAVYLYSGMADIARLTGDETLLKACEKLWDNIVNEKMYITGGIGGTHIGEAFSFGYDLPNDTAYAETCASIGLVFFARRMLEMKANAKYADIMERALYNGILSGMALDGKSFFYVNPLETLPEACHKDTRKEHVKPVRQKWFGCACCPPNIARLLSSIASYAFTETEETLFVHLYMGSILQKKVGNQQVEITIESEMPWNGKVSFQVKTEKESEFTLALRIPDWCDGKYEISGISLKDKKIEDGYLYITRNWSNGASFEIDFTMDMKVIEANPMVREDIGKVAIMRGPIVYCLEEKDNGKDLHLVKLTEDLHARADSTDEMGIHMVEIKTKGKRKIVTDTSISTLYSDYKPASYDDITLTWIPYFTWANRGEGEMQVWVRV